MQWGANTSRQRQTLSRKTVDQNVTQLWRTIWRSSSDKGVTQENKLSWCGPCTVAHANLTQRECKRLTITANNRIENNDWVFHRRDHLQVRKTVTFEELQGKCYKVVALPRPQGRDNLGQPGQPTHNACRGKAILRALCSRFAGACCDRSSTEGSTARVLPGTTPGLKRTCFCCKQKYQTRTLGRFKVVRHISFPLFF